MRLRIQSTMATQPSCMFSKVNVGHRNLASKANVAKMPSRTGHTNAKHYPRAGVRALRLETNAISVMVNDCSGKMGHAVAEAAVDAGLTLVPYALTGSRSDNIVACGGVPVTTVGVDADRDALIKQLKEDYEDLIVVDYTVPIAANENAKFYAKHGLNYVMGTTGGDSEAMAADAESSGVYAVIAPQMGKQVVAFQAAMDLMAKQFPGAFAGYTLRVVESHQSTKVDTSGTAKAIVGSFNELGLEFDVSQIEKVRVPSEQINDMGVPEDALTGHAFHTYELSSPDGQVQFSFKHNVCGRSIYAQGTVDAVLFLAAKVKAGGDQRVYNMIDVLREGNMR